MGGNIRLLVIAGLVVALLAIGSGIGILANRTVYASPDSPCNSQDSQRCSGPGSVAGHMSGIMGSMMGGIGGNCGMMGAKSGNSDGARSN
ncbi:MAG: hypothetical protein Q7O66_15150 [Dehalococcoidia bacterium]|nr:hypothetical protein [Dehalococcoidia bacterium]